MGSFENHKNLYLNFKKDAENINNSEPSRAELYFLSIYHLIESCAAKNKKHINKHQKLRKFLVENTEIFKSNTTSVWQSFQTIETRIRPKFSYGVSWEKKDFEEIKAIYFDLEQICLKVIESDS